MKKQIYDEKNGLSYTLLEIIICWIWKSMRKNLHMGNME